MFKSGFKSEAAEIQCRLCLGRIKLMRNKRGLQLKQNRKEVSELLRSGKQEYARIRVEGVIREQLMLQAYEILELYMELLAVRAQLVAKTKEIPRDMVEAISSVIYAAERVGDFPELVKLRKMFESKYGPEYVKEATNDATRSKWQVNQNLIRCLLVEAPQPEEKLATLSEIAQEHGVEWDLSAAARDLLPPEAAPSFVAGGGAPSSAVGAASGAIPMMHLPGAGPGAGQAYQPPPFVPAGADGQPPAGAGAGAAFEYAPPGGMPRMPPMPAAHGAYTNANQAAAAAAAAAAQAQAAADYAAQFAMHQAGLAAAAGGGGPAAPAQGAALGAGWLAQQAHGAPLPLAPGIAPNPSVASDLSSNGGYSNASGGGVPAGDFVQRSSQDIQRAYDEAVGAPEKPHTATAPPPGTPLTPPPGGHPFGAPGPGPAPGSDPFFGGMPSSGVAPDLPRPPSHVAKPHAPPGGGLSLPAPPAARVQPGAPGAPSQPEDEYEALTRRLEALKRS